MLYLATIKGGREFASPAVAFEGGNDCAIDPGLVTECVSDVPGGIVIKRYAPRRMKFTRGCYVGNANDELANNFSQKHAKDHKTQRHHFWRALGGLECARRRCQRRKEGGRSGQQMDGRQRLCLAPFCLWGNCHNKPCPCDSMVWVYLWSTQAAQSRHSTKINKAERKETAAWSTVVYRR